MARSRSGWVALGWGLWLTACPAKPPPAPDLEVVATVNGEALSRTAFEAELTRELRAVEAGLGRAPEQVAPFQRALLETMVERTLLLQAARQMNVTVPPDEVERRVLALSSDYAGQGFDQAMSQGQLSAAELRRRTADLLTIEKLFSEHVYPKVKVSEEQVAALYASRAEALETPEQVRAAQILVKDAAEAKRLHAQLKLGKRFDDLARRFSLSPDARVGGDLGFFPRGQMPPAFDEVVFKLDLNQVSDVVHTEYGYQLFKLLEKRPARRPELAEVREKLEEELLRDARAKAQTEYVKALRDKAALQIHQASLQAASQDSKGPATQAPPKGTEP